MLHIYLLGVFRLINENELLTTVTAGRLQSLFTYLVLHQKDPQPRQRIACLFWPDATEKQARTNLRNLIHLLNQALPDSERYLCTDGPTLYWKPDADFTLDVFELEKAMAAGLFKTVVDLYIGDLLPDIYDEWVVIKREELRQMYAESLGQLMRQKEKEGVYHEAIRYSQHLIRHEPLQEQSYRELMHLYALSGDLTGIVRTYKTCVTVLQSELGIDPGEETCKTYDSCLKMCSETVTPTHSVSYSNMEYPTCLPYQITTFIGRKREKAEVRELVKLHRLVSLVGAGGVGKTRLALAVAEDLLGDFTDGVRYINLALFSDHTRVIQTVAFLLGIREGGGTPLISLLTKHLLNKHMLLFLDNCENAIDAVRYLTDTLLHAVPNIWFLITSRIVLNIQGEVIWRVPTLATPGLSKWDVDERTQPDNSSDDCQLETLQQFESVQLFTDRAEAVLPTFSITKDNAWYIGRICQQLDGIPLALELAAARVKLLTVQQIADHLGDALYLLTQGDPMALPHHQTMLATLNWSHNRLSNEAQILFRRLSVFVGGATFDAIEAICSGNDIKKDQILDLLSYLVDKSLIEVGSFNKYIRFRLHEITRQYAFVKLKESGEISDRKNRHLEYFCCLTESMEPDLEGGRSTDSTNRQVIEMANIQAALQWSTQKQGNTEYGIRLATASIGFWEARGLLAQGRLRLEKMLAMVDPFVKPLVRARALTALGRASSGQGDFETGQKCFEQSLAIDRELNNTIGVANNLSRLGAIYAIQQKPAMAIQYLEECLELYRALGNEGGVAYALDYMAYIYFRQGNLSAAHSFVNEGSILFKKLNMVYFDARSKYLLGLLARVDKDYVQARSFFSDATNYLLKMGNFGGVINLLAALGGLHAEEKRSELAARIFGAIESLSEKFGAHFTPAQHMDVERDITLARKDLGEKAFAESWSEGHSMTLEQAVACALETA